ncbi:MAG: hypothetical protein IJQ73_07515 [Kiritimatiellae bacterium]|nr:hypothetical protein [Kiritimatiellia bacterium]
MKTHAILLFSAALALGGCATDDARLRELDEALREAVRDAWAKAAAEAAQGEVAPPSGVEVAPAAAGEAAPSSDGEVSGGEAAATSGEAATSASADAAPFASLKWPWGGFDGSKAALSDKARIKALKVTASGLSYAWESGGCEDLGASSKTDASCLACLFCLDGSSWRGGEFEWISTSRTSRDLKNIESGYNGWDAAAFRSAKAHAFCIVSKDGRRRTNVIVQEGGLK